MRRNVPHKISSLANEQGAVALMTAMLTFLNRNNISKRFILEVVRRRLGTQNTQNTRLSLRRYAALVRAYEDMGMIMSSWYSQPKFLDLESRPLPLSEVQGPHSIRALVRSSHVKINHAMAIDLMRQSPSVRIDNRGNFVAVKRIFVLPNFEVPRAALVIQRYLDTLQRNSSAHRAGTTLLLERNCHVREIEFKKITPLLRDIKARGTAFMDSVDGDIEAHRIRRSKQKGVGELGVLVFAWTRPSKNRRSNSEGKVL